MQATQKTKVMGIGNRYPVQLVQYTEDKNIKGSWVETREDPRSMWAEVLNPSGFRAYQNGQTQLGESRDFVVRFRFDLYPNCNWKVIFQGRRWTITEIRQVDEKQFYYRLSATSKGV